MTLSWNTLRLLQQDYGDSFFVLDIRQFESNYREFLDAFRSRYSNTHLGYSYKTNYIPRLCRAVNAAGGYAEVVSGMEYELAIAIGVSPERIIFNGPLKYPAEIEGALLAGSLVNLDGLDDVATVEALARRLPDKQLSVGLRCNLDIGTGRVSRFGFDTDSDQLDAAFTRLRALSHCTVDGLHCHITTSERTKDSYARRTKLLLDLVGRYFTASPPRFIDVGGGFFGKMTDQLKRQFTGDVPTYVEYAEAIAPQMRQRFSDDEGPSLIVEPGMAIVSDVLKFVARVVGVKTVRSRQLALVAGSVHNVNLTRTEKTLPLHVYRDRDDLRQGRLTGPVDIVGYTCLEHDCLYRGYQGAIDTGDFTVFDNVGAYSVVLKPPFIRPAPPIVCYDSLEDTFTLVKRQETLRDVLATYVI